MRLRFVNKHTVKNKPQEQQASVQVIKTNDTAEPVVASPVEEDKAIQKVEKPSVKKNKKAKKEDTMDTVDNLEKIETAENLMAEMEPQVKVLKADKGLIERTESSKIILTEDNRQVLND